MTEVPARDVLDRLFRAIVREAENNDAFARSLIERCRPIWRPGPGRKPRAQAVRCLAAACHQRAAHARRERAARQAGAGQGGEDLRAVARFSGLLLTGPAARPKAKRGDMIEGIIAAAKHYDAQRSTASA